MSAAGVNLPDHLDLIAAAPVGIQKLRGLILELAVRGKLVPQDPNDEPASELLKRIAKERARLEAEEASRNRRQRRCWAMMSSRLRCPIAGNGLVYPPKFQSLNPRNSADDSTIDLFRPYGIDWHKFRGRSIRKSSVKWADIKQGVTHFAEGDVGVAKITPCFENSKACVFENLQSGLGAGIDRVAHCSRLSLRHWCRATYWHTSRRQCSCWLAKPA